MTQAAASRPANAPSRRPPPRANAPPRPSPRREIGPPKRPTARERAATPPVPPAAPAVVAPPKAQRGGLGASCSSSSSPPWRRRWRSISGSLRRTLCLNRQRVRRRRQTEVTPYVTGPIVAIHVKEGQAVKVGDPLFDIDPGAVRDRAGSGAGPAGGGQDRVRQSQVAVRQQRRPDQNGRRFCAAASGRFRPQAQAGWRPPREPRPTRILHRWRSSRRSRSWSSCAACRKR